MAARTAINNPASTSRMGGFFVGLLLLLFLGLAAAVVAFPKQVTWDPSYGVLAAMQYEKGISPDMRTIVMADPRDLSASENRRVTLWAPAYQAVPLAVRSLGVSWGGAFRIVILGCLIAGSLCWFLYFRSFDPGAAPLVMLLALCTAYTLDAAMWYQGGDLLLWTAAPMLVLLNAAALRSARFMPRLVLAILGGFCSTAIYAVKFSGIFLGVGIFVAWMIQAILFAPQRKKLPAWCVGAALGVLFLFKFHVIGGGTAVATAGSRIDPLGAVAAFGFWPAAMTDLSTAIISLWGKLHLPEKDQVALVSLTGWVIILALGILASAERDKISSVWKSIRENHDLVIFVGIVVMAVDSLLYVSVVFFGSTVSLDARLARISGTLALPVAFLLVRSCLANRRGPARIAAVFLLVTLFLFPPAFGLTRTFSEARTFYRARGQLANDQGLVNQHFHLPDRINALIAEFRQHVPSTKTVLYTTYPNVMFFLPTQRCIVVPAVEWFTVSQLRAASYVHPPPEGVALLVPAEFMENGKLAAIKSSFRDVYSWQSIPMKTAPDWTLCLSTNP